MSVPCVGGVVRDDDGRLLMVCRRNAPGAGLWSIPGGRVEAGENGPAAVVREVREETGLEVEPGALLGSVEIPFDAPGAGTLVVDDYVCRVVGGTLRAGDDATDARWVDRAALDVLAQRGDVVDGLLDALTAWDALPR